MRATAMRGKQSVEFLEPVYIKSAASVVGQKEGEGPLKNTFDMIVEDPYFDTQSWEESESKFMKTAAEIAIRKADLQKENIRYAFAGDLLGQLIATSFGMMSLELPLFGVYGACSNIGMAISLASMVTSAGFADYTLAVSSSHFGSAEKQFRFPLEYGNQRPLSSTWTVTGSGAFVIGRKKTNIKVRGITTGKIVDYGIKDAQNMGGAMAPAASHVIYQCLKDFNFQVNDFDKIITGDLGEVGQEILCKLLRENGYAIRDKHMDCGMEIFDKETQNTNSGGSGCACSAVVLAGFIADKIRKGEWKRVLFVPTGALLSTVSFNEGKSVPGIAHGIILESEA